VLVNLTGERWLHIKWDAIDSSHIGNLLFHGTYREISCVYWKTTGRDVIVNKKPKTVLKIVLTDNIGIKAITDINH